MGIQCTLNYQDLAYPELDYLDQLNTRKYIYHVCAEGVAKDHLWCGYVLSHELRTSLAWSKLTDQHTFLYTTGHDHTV